MKTPLITREGYEKLKKEMDYLWREERPEVTKKVTWAASLGDRKGLLALAQSLGLGAEGVAPEEPGEGAEGDTGGQESGGSGQEGGGKTALTLTGAGPAQAELIKALAGLWGLAVKEGE